MQLYNTMTRKKETFTPRIEGKVGLYACGITAYDYSHVGHARSAIVFDVLVRYLRHIGYEVTFVRNFTDVDDKIIARAKADGVASQDIAERFIEAFHEDMDALGVQRADKEPRATEFIGDMIIMCQTLIQKGHAYASPSGDVYFRVRSFADYGKLSRRSVDDLMAGARILPGEEKEDPLDFALWKSAKPGEPSWDSPWGQGRPGWHIECSAMSERELPLPLDIHGGGQDLIFPHHENEIAQTEAATGKELARFWVHNGFVQVDSEKMSKSLNNFKTIRDILGSYLPEVLRFFLLARHYRSPIDFSVEAMEEAEKNLRRMYETLSLVTEECERAAPKGGQSSREDAEEFLRLSDGWREAMADDINSAAALGHINSLIRMANRILDDKGLRKNAGNRKILEDILALSRDWSAVLGILTMNPEVFLEKLKKCRAIRNNIDLGRVEELMTLRLAAREEKNFAESDRIRDSLAELGVVVRDTAKGAIWDIS